jgi:hypothetical protein
MSALRATFAIARREMRPSWLRSVALRVAFGAVLACIGRFYFHYGDVDVMSLVAVPLGVIAGIEPRVRDLTYFIAPLYGRQLARAHAITAVIAALVFPIAFLVAHLFSSHALGYAGYLDYSQGVHLDVLRGPPQLIDWDSMIASKSLVAAVASVAAALIALSATLRRGVARVAYLALGCLAGYFITTFSLTSLMTLSFLGADVFIPEIAGESVAGLLIGFFALRAFGETLARYDPIP